MLFGKQNEAKHNTGKLAEKQAEKYLKKKGLKPVERNYSCRQGEIDLIMRDGNTLVFVEVKYRKSTQYGTPLENVTKSKQQKLMLAAQHYLQTNKIYENAACRFDVVGISGEDTQWVTAAF